MKAVILAAGPGRRLQSILRGKPKPLLELCGRPLITHILLGLRETGVSEAILVVGYRARLLVKYLRRLKLNRLTIRWIFNDEYLRGNGVSLAKVLPFLDGDSFLLAMSDHLFEPNLVYTLLDQGETLSLAVDKKPRYLRDVGEATKVLVSEEGAIVDIGKEIPMWNGVDTGFFILDREIVKIAERLSRINRYVSLSEILKYVISEGRSVKAVDVSGCFWIDIDTPEDFIFAERFLVENV